MTPERIWERERFAALYAPLTPEEREKERRRVEEFVRISARYVEAPPDYWTEENRENARRNHERNLGRLEALDCEPAQGTLF